MTPSFSLLRRSALGLLGFVLLLAAASAAPVKFDIPAQPAPAALDLFITQSGVQVMYVADELKTVTANAVVGEYEPETALGLLLKGTGWTSNEQKPGWFAVVKEKPAALGSLRGSITYENGAPAPDVLVVVKETMQSVSTNPRGEYVFSAVPPGTYTLVVSSNGFQPLHITDVVVNAGKEVSLSEESMRKASEVATMEPFEVKAKTIAELEKYLVTDTKPEPFSDRNVDLPRTINDAQPYYIFNSQTIEESGSVDVEDFLKQRLTMDTTAQTSKQTTFYSRNITGGLAGNTTSSINLQGLGANHTLILVNGLPMPGVSVFSGAIATPGQPDVNGIPMAAIDRIEVLPSSAGAIYGAGAEGGVINIILKKSYNGGDITATYASTWDGYGPSRTIEATLGRSFEHGKTQLFVTAQYSDEKPMFVGDRVNLLNRGYATLYNTQPSLVGNFSSFGSSVPVVGATTNIGSDDGSNLTLKSTGASLNSPIATLPLNYTGNLSTIIAGSWNNSPGEDNALPNGLLMPLGNYPTRKSLMATLTRQMTPNLQLHVDFANTDNYSFSNFNPINLSGGVYIPAGVPTNPFNQNVDVAFPINYSAPATSNSVTNTITAGGIMKLPFDWVANLNYQWSEASFESLHTGNIAASVLSTSTPTFGTVRVGGVRIVDSYPTPYYAGVINPFTDTLTSPIDWSPFTQSTYESGQTIANDLVLAASGPVFHFPWGDPRLSIRLEHNKTGEPQGAVFSLAPTNPSNIYPGLPLNWYSESSYGQTQTVDSVNAEIDVPIFRTKKLFLHSLDLQLNFSNETTSVSVGSPGYLTIHPYAYNTTGGTTGPIPPLLSTGQPYRAKAVSSYTGFTGPALNYKPTDDIIIRASIASGYVAPTYAQLLPNATPNATTTSITDPKNPAAGSYPVQTYSGGNPQLKPETSKSWDLGVIWEPKGGFLNGFRFDAEFTETKQQNVILAPSIQTIVNLEDSFQNLVVRSPSTGLVSTVYDIPINLAEAKEDAWNFTVDYRLPTAIGTFDLSGAETIEEHNQQQIVAGTQYLEYVGYPNSGGVAKTKATGILRWSYHNWVASWTTVIFGGYKQYGAPGDPGAYASQLETNTPVTSLNTTYLVAQGSYTIPSQLYNNIYISYHFSRNPMDGSSSWGRYMNEILNGVKVSFAVNNVFNTAPPFDAYYQPFFTSPYGDIQGRNFQLSIKKTF